MEQEYRHAVALMRYSAIAPLIPGLPEGYKNLSTASLELCCFFCAFKRRWESGISPHTWTDPAVNCPSPN